MPILNVDGYPIAYAEAGSGTPLVMVHGTLGDQRSFAGQMEAFGAKYHAIAISLRHCWPDKWREDGDFTIARHMADVAGFIRGLGKGKVHLIGHSRGGHIAFRVAQHHPWCCWNRAANWMKALAVRRRRAIRHQPSRAALP
jgi:pimeloyl-ACP methyl ester carboxylesterase